MQVARLGGLELTSVATDRRNIYRGSMDDNVMERARQLIAEIERGQPELVNSCKAAGAAFVVIDQDAFAPNLRTNELFLLGKANAWLVGKEVRIIPSPRRPS